MTRFTRLATPLTLRRNTISITHTVWRASSFGNTCNNLPPFPPFVVVRGSRYTVEILKDFYSCSEFLVWEAVLWIFIIANIVAVDFFKVWC
jgi:hypothetical protein